jgi:hypothetical protein
MRPDIRQAILAGLVGIVLGLVAGPVAAPPSADGGGLVPRHVVHEQDFAVGFRLEILCDERWLGSCSARLQRQAGQQGYGDQAHG